MLGPGAGVAVPAVVRDVDEDLGAFGGELADFAGEDGFVADEDAEFVVSGSERGARGAMGKIANRFGESGGEREDVAEGDVLAEGDEMDFVVTR